MRHLKFFNRFRQYLQRGRRRPSPEKLRIRPRLEELENRLVLSTLYIDSGDHAEFVGNSALSSETLTMSEKTVPTIFGYVAERTWHPSQKLKKEPDGSVVLEVHLDDTHEIKAWALSFGPRATVLEPAAMREEVINDLERLLKNYRSKERSTK